MLHTMVTCITIRKACGFQQSIKFVVFSGLVPNYGYQKYEVL